MAEGEERPGEETDKEDGEAPLMEIRPSRKYFVKHYIGAMVLIVLGLLKFFEFFSIPQVPSLQFIDLNLFIEIFLFTSAFVLIITPEIRRMAVKYIITDTDVWENFGYFEKNSVNVPLVKIQRCDLTKSVKERAMNVGDIEVDTGEDYFVMEGVADPTEVREFIVEKMKETSMKSSGAAVHE